MTTLSFFILINHSEAQNLENIGKANPIKVTGGFGLNQTFYGVDGIPNRRPPYIWAMNANVTFSLYGWAVPFSASWSNQNVQVRQPFNQYGMSPTYKWITLHAGYRSMNFSSYTLAGVTFLGGGVELKPGKLRFAAMYGRLQKAVQEDTLSSQNIVPAYQRMGGGFKIGVGKGSDFIDFIFFAAKDDPNSLPYVPVTAPVLPASNVVMSVNAQKKLGKRVSMSGEYASSSYTRDITAPETENTRKSLLNPFVANRTSTQYYYAFKSALTYTAKVYSIQLGYERIGPEYRTLGAYFFNNDLQNITVAPSVRMFKQKLSIAANVGVQRDNIKNQKISTQHRILTSFNVNYMPNDKWSFMAQYSNFYNYSRISNKFNQFNTLDTLNLYQITESTNGNVAYSFGTKERRQGINLNISFQRANQTQGEEVTNNTSKFYNGNLSYRINFVPSATTFALGLNANQNSMSGFNSLAIGPTASAGKQFFKKTLRTNFTATYNTVFNEQSSNGNALTLNLSAGYAVVKHHNLNANITLLNRNNKGVNAVSYMEFTGLVGYNYSF